QFNMKWVEPAGLVKFDFLGLTTLTVLETATRLVKQRGVDIDLARIPLDDKKTYDLLARAEAVGIFQLESQGMRRALLDMRPDRFEDIIALVALYRPGPMANIPTYCPRKHRPGEPDYIHPTPEPGRRETFGVIVYQKQVMPAAPSLPGYSVRAAELPRLKVEPPSFNRSGVAFEVEGETIHYALAALKGVGRQAVEAIVEARGSKPFADLSDFAGRVNPRAVNKRVLESLAAAGAFEALEGNRARVFAAVDGLLAVAQREHEA